MPATRLGAPNLINLAAAPASVSTNLADPGALSQNITLTPTGKFAAPLTYTVSKKSGATSLVTVTPGATTHIAASLANYGSSLSETYTVKATDYLGRWGSVDIPVAFSISKKPTVTTVGNTASVSAGQAATVTVTVAGASPTGTVVFSDMSTNTTLGTGALSNGSASIATGPLIAGSHVFRVDYSGDGANSSSIGSSLLNVGKASSSVNMNPSTTLQEIGWGVVFWTHVNGYLPGQSVTYTEGATNLATVAVDGAGNAAYSTWFGTAGNHVITATYSGDANNNASNTAVTVGIFPPIVVSTTSDLGPGSNLSWYKALAKGGKQCGASIHIVGGATGGTGSYTYTWNLVQTSKWVTMTPSGATLALSLNLPVSNVN